MAARTSILRAAEAGAQVEFKRPLAMIALISLIALILAAQAKDCTNALGCTSDEECVAGQCQPATPCTTDAECTSLGATMKCLKQMMNGAGYCKPTCNSVKDCQTGYSCTKFDSISFCVPKCEGRHSDCPSGSYCMGNIGVYYCRFGCAQNYDCPSWQTCSASKCVDTMCTIEADCKGGQKCISGRCIAEGCVAAGSNAICSGLGECASMGTCACYDPDRTDKCNVCLRSGTVSGNNCTYPVCKDSAISSNCTSCSSAGKCSKCLDGLTNPNQDCRIQCPHNCATCSVDGKVCTKCAPGYSGGMMCMADENCPASSEYANCQLCSGTTCTSCRPGFSNPAGKCTVSCDAIRDVFRCDANNPSVATACVYPGSMLPYCTPACLPRCKDGSEKCVYGDKCVPKSCASLYDKINGIYFECMGNGTCTNGLCSCRPGLNLDPIWNCQRCVTGYVMNSNRECVKRTGSCAVNCEECNGNTCVKCYPGYVDPQHDCDTKCNQNGCITCLRNNPILCMDCDISVKPIYNTSALCIPRCNPECTPKDGQQTICALNGREEHCVIEQCSTSDALEQIVFECNGVGECDMNKKQCVSCPNPDTMTSECTCLPGFGYQDRERKELTEEERVDHLCKKFNCMGPQGYASCNTQGMIQSGTAEEACDTTTGLCMCQTGWTGPNCERCSPGYKLTGKDYSDYQCVREPALAIDCKDTFFGNDCAECTFEKCTRCLHEQAVDGRKCTATGYLAPCTRSQIDSGCTACSPMYKHLCLTCQPGLILDVTDMYHKCIEPSKCTGNHKVAKNRCVYNCGSKFSNCAACDDARCTRCMPAFRLRGGVCTPCPADQPGDGILCHLCKTDYVMNADKSGCIKKECMQNVSMALPGCLHCDPVFPTRCIVCRPGMSMDLRDAKNARCIPAVDCLNTGGYYF